MIKRLTDTILSENYKSYKNEFVYIDDLTNYFKKNVLYEIEVLYIENKVNTKNYKILDIVFLDSGIKYVYVRNNDTFNVDMVVIPKLNILYTIKQHYEFRYCYKWSTRDKVVLRYSSSKLYNRNKHRYYIVGDCNKYGWKLESISRDVNNDFNYRVPTYVTLDFN